MASKGNNIVSRYLIWCIVFTSLSCSTSKKVSIVERTPEELIQSLTNRNIDFKYVNAKLSTSVDNPDESISGTMQVKMQKDSAILVSVKKFGIEAAKIYVNPKSYTILYKFENAYEIENLDKIKNVFAINAEFNDLQQLLIGNVMVPQMATATVIKDADHYMIKSNEDNLTLEYTIHGKSLELTQLKITDLQNRSVIMQYADYRMYPGKGKIAYQRNITYPFSDTETGTIELNISEIVLDKPSDIKFSIPDHYEKIN
jgi:Domain of unknown function (DUF4292)